MMKERQHLQKSADGVYRWNYEYHMLKDPTIFLTILKILVISMAVPFLLVSFLSLIQGEGIAPILKEGKGFLILLAIILILALAGYLIVAARYGWKYQVLFEMDEKSILHAQQEKQFGKAEALSWLTAVAGAAAGKPGATGSGILAATKSSLRSTFSNVKSIKGYPRRGVIKVNEPFAKNQIYVEKEDYDFVWNYLVSHCPKARVKP